MAFKASLAGLTRKEKRALYKRRALEAGSLTSIPTYRRALFALLRAEVRPAYAAAPRKAELLAAVGDAWSVPGLDPQDGGLRGDRLERKRAQVANLCWAFGRLAAKRRASERGAPRPLLVIEFAASSGYVALPLARRHPEHRFVVLDMNSRALAIAKERVARAGLGNVAILHGLVQDLPPELRAFDVGIGLHACGVVSDLILEHCIASRAACILCPCCTGKIAGGRWTRGVDAEADAERRCREADDSDDEEAAVNDAGKSCRVLSGGALLPRLGAGARPAPAVEAEAPRMPRSRGFAAHLSDAWYAALARAGDVHRQSATEPRLRDRRLAKAFIEADRGLRAREAGFASEVFVLTPPSATPKNDCIVAWPLEWDGGAAGEQAAPAAPKQGAPAAPPAAPDGAAREAVDAIIAEATEALSEEWLGRAAAADAGAGAS